MNRLESTAAFLAWILFAVLTYQVAVHGPVTAIDAAAIAWAAAHRSDMLTRGAYWVSETGGPSMTSVYAAIVTLILLARRRLAGAIAVAFIVYGAIALNVGVKHALQRGRPVMEDPLVHLITYSYPSGHSAAATVFGGLLILILAQYTANRRASVIGSTAILLWIAAVCATRIYLGAHYPTDVAGGVLEGTGWILLCSLALRRWQIPLEWRHRPR